MGETRVRVVAGPGLVADPAVLRELTDAECAGLGVAGEVRDVPDAQALRRELADGESGPLVVLPGPDPAVRALMRQPGAPASGPVWCDLTRTGPVEVAPGGAHLYGRGVWGLCLAIRHSVYRVRWPAQRTRYGTDPDQWGELRLPADPSTASRPVPVPVPVAVLVHGGYWRSIWGADLMDALAVDLAGRGFAAWNLEYRRPDRHGWEATTADIAAGVAAVATLPGQLDLDRVVVIGHSAGGQLALRLAADAAGGSPPVALAVSLAGVVDLREAHRRWLSNGAVASALGGTPEQIPALYASADPLSRLPLRVPQLVVQGQQDDPDLVDLNRRYVAAARAAGDEVRCLEQPGDHFAVIDPAAPIWRAAAAEITRGFHGDGPSGDGEQLRTAGA